MEITTDQIGLCGLFLVPIFLSMNAGFIILILGYRNIRGPKKSNNISVCKGINYMIASYGLARTSTDVELSL